MQRAQGQLGRTPASVTQQERAQRSPALPAPLEAPPDPGHAGSMAERSLQGQAAYDRGSDLRRAAGLDSPHLQGSTVMQTLRVLGIQAEKAPASVLPC